MSYDRLPETDFSSKEEENKYVYRKGNALFLSYLPIRKDLFLPHFHLSSFTTPHISTLRSAETMKVHLATVLLGAASLVAATLANTQTPPASTFTTIVQRDELATLAHTLSSAPYSVIGSATPNAVTLSNAPYPVVASAAPAPASSPERVLEIPEGPPPHTQREMHDWTKPENCGWLKDWAIQFWCNLRAL